MSLFTRQVPAATIARLARDLPTTPVPPAVRLRCLCKSTHPPLTCDYLHWSAWQDKDTGQLWLHSTGGIANTDTWYGPANPSLADSLP